MLLLQPLSSSTCLQSIIANEGDKHKDCAFSLERVISQWHLLMTVIGPSLLGILFVIVTNANSLAISLVKPQNLYPDL
jgi:hypothetical protein